MNFKNGRLLFITASIVGVLISSCSGTSGEIEPTACNCGDLYSGKFNPSNIEYTAEELNNGDKMREDVDKFVELGKACAIKFGNLSEIEKELVKGSTSLSTIPNIDQAVDNAKSECN